MAKARVGSIPDHAARRAGQEGILRRRLFRVRVYVYRLRACVVISIDATAPLTIVVPSADHVTPIEYPGRIVIDTEVALYHADRVCALDARTLGQAAQVLGTKTSCDIWFGKWRGLARGPRALIGRIDLHLKLTSLGAACAHVGPEDGLHPRACCELGDLFVKWMRDSTAGLDSTAGPDSPNKED